jgi:drug/metabolite transporter (DMT)-like permease
LTASVFLIVLFAAAVHASWSAAVKGDPDPRAMTLAMSVFSGVIALPLIPFLPPVPVEMWWYMAASILIHVVYMYALSQAYRFGDLGLVYPIARGVAPTISAIGAALFVSEIPGLTALSGIVLVTIGACILALPAWRSGRNNQAAILFALLSATMTAAYTIVDGLGTRVSGSALAFIVWLNLGTAIANLAIEWFSPGRGKVAGIVQRWKFGLAGGFFSSAGYGLVLWAMTKAPIATVAALRETSIVFASLIGIFLLKEKASRPRIAGAAVIVAGAIAIRMA